GAGDPARHVGFLSVRSDPLRSRAPASSLLTRASYTCKHPAGRSAMFAEFDTLIKSLDLPAKVRLLTGATMFTLAPQESIGLHEMRFSDGPTGVRGLKFHGGRIVALLPNATLLASAWSEETTHEVGGILAEEALAQQIHVVLGPTINL